MDKTSLGDRMKGYEKQAQRTLLRRTPVIVRVDGKAFHSYTKGLPPFYGGMEACREDVMKFLYENVQGCVLAYAQSDEISLLLKDWTRFTSEPYFDNKQSKIESVIASMATWAWSKSASIFMPRTHFDKPALFDARAFNVPMNEVVNYFLWRQQDATRNSIQMLGQANFSHNELHGKSCNEIQNMLITQKDVNWNDMNTWQKRGSCFTYGQYDFKIPIFSDDRGYIERLLKQEEV